MKKLVAPVLLGLCCLAYSPEAWAAGVTRQLPFSKKVNLSFPKTYLFKFQLCADTDCADVAYGETQQIDLKTTTLNFSLGAGKVDPPSSAFGDVDFSQQYWLRISRRTTAGFVPVGTVTKLSAVPYALWSSRVEDAGGITGVYGGDGLSGSGTIGDITLNVGAGSGIAVGADTVSLLSGGVTSTHIQDGAVTSAKIADGSIAGSDLASGAVTSASILDGTVTSADIAPGAVASAHMATGGVTSAHIQDGAITSAKIADGSIAGSDLAFNYAGSASKGGPANDSDLVDGRHAAALRPILRRISNLNSTSMNSTACANLTDLVIAVPVSGTILVEYDVTVGIEHINGLQDYASFYVGTTSTDCSSYNPFITSVDVPSSYPTGFSGRRIHAAREFSVGAGTHTYFLNGQMLSGYGNNDRMFYPFMRAVFYPD